MNDEALMSHLIAIEAALPESALSARIAVGCVMGELVARQQEIERLRVELEKRPGLVLLAGGVT